MNKYSIIQLISAILDHLLGMTELSLHHNVLTSSQQLRGTFSFDVTCLRLLTMTSANGISCAPVMQLRSSSCCCSLQLRVGRSLKPLKKKLIKHCNCQYWMSTYTMFSIILCCNCCDVNVTLRFDDVITHALSWPELSSTSSSNQSSTRHRWG